MSHVMGISRGYHIIIRGEEMICFLHLFGDTVSVLFPYFKKKIDLKFHQDLEDSSW